MTSAAYLSDRRVLADLIPGTLARDVSLVAGGAALTGLAAQLSFTIPAISPVPFTLQTLAVLVTGAALGTWRGMASLALYLAVGMAGAPWFAGHTAGWQPALFGYLIGFVVAAGVVGALAKRGADRRVWSMVALMAIGAVIIWTAGAGWLIAAQHYNLGTAISKGVVPFVAGDAVKLAVAALAFPAAWKLARR
ncbi:MAG: biotin transporter BioY [Actinomycetia bacterium]|nr:biotin transporter BioY [Actinomycetes bacterium]